MENPDGGDRQFVSPASIPNLRSPSWFPLHLASPTRTIIAASGCRVSNLGDVLEICRREPALLTRATPHRGLAPSVPVSWPPLSIIRFSPGGRRQGRSGRIEWEQRRAERCRRRWELFDCRACQVFSVMGLSRQGSQGDREARGLLRPGRRFFLFQRLGAHRGATKIPADVGERRRWGGPTVISNDPRASCGALARPHGHHDVRRIRGILKEPAGPFAYIQSEARRMATSKAFLAPAIPRGGPLLSGNAACANGSKRRRMPSRLKTPPSQATDALGATIRPGPAIEVAIPRLRVNRPPLTS